MPEDLPEAVKILLWLLVGVIVFGYLIMDKTILSGFIFAIFYFGIPIIWRLNKKKNDTADDS